jgi:hypothetical protein
MKKTACGECGAALRGHEACWSCGVPCDGSEPAAEAVAAPEEGATATKRKKKTSAKKKRTAKK